MSASTTDLVSAGPETAGPANPPLTTRTWYEPEGIAPRGTLVVLVGRGETPQVYERFGRRLAADAYRVVAVAEQVRTGGARDEPEGEGDLVDAVLALLADDDLPSPRVLVGSDAGATTAVTVARRARVDALVLAGLPTHEAVGRLDWDVEVQVRTACPNHQGVLRRAATGGIRNSPAGSPPVLPAGLGTADELDLPVLAVHGARDEISPVQDAVDAYRRLGAVQVTLVEDGLHDILNDVTHRSVAATIVLFLERLRLGAELPVIVRDASA